MVSHYIIVALVYMAISLLVTIVVSLINPASLKGRFILVFVFSLFAAFLGAIIFTVFKPVFMFFTSIYQINIYPPLFATIGAVIVMIKVAAYRDKNDD